MSQHNPCPQHAAVNLIPTCTAMDETVDKGFCLRKSHSGKTFLVQGVSGQKPKLCLLTPLQSLPGKDSPIPCSEPPPGVQDIIMQFSAVFSLRSGKISWLPFHTCISVPYGLIALPNLDCEEQVWFTPPLQNKCTQSQMLKPH